MSSYDAATKSINRDREQERNDESPESARLGSE